jgi:hypothetical protein
MRVLRVANYLVLSIVSVVTNGDWQLIRPDEIISAVDVLERHGLLLRGGRLIRFVPDLLSDFILEGACLTAAGDSTRFSDGSVFLGWNVIVHLTVRNPVSSIVPLGSSITF